MHPLPGNLRRVSIRVPAAEAEIARALLLSLAPAGFEEVETEGLLELAAYTDEPGEARIRAKFAHVSSVPVEEGWEDRWRAFHRPVRVGGLWIGPPWEMSPADEPAVVVDPGRAFGTGGHATTRASIELLAGLQRGSLLDAGCGSGVIAVAATRLGFEPVFAVDLDPTAVEVTRNTARRNGAEIEVRQADVLRDDLPSVEVVVANIELRVIEPLLARRLATRAITSGYLAHEKPQVPGWERVSRLELDGWAADVFVSARAPRAPNAMNVHVTMRR
jgi:ribosomal protein L11 methyltransferase